ncbi:hypothetical protein TRFO_36665 [Tritrichomonas foetus]|uniref:Uncharacterized protein n=1 Tax=Tritrichomonas foetus TaxID=1144522 RepID=A0A1J4JDJ9_9EUKA|nr:hypothetical protein TRFO_36665 [Tritrichomonas foetus]|eukprot:OHS97176.1 hypothetical protein TRFO_36665 [Tritrichomonas foetus]
MQGIIKNFINGAVSAYMTEVVTKNISGSLAHQNLDIAELEIFPNALLQHGVPLEIKKGTIRNIRIQVPTRFLSDPIKVTIDSVTIVGSLCNNVPTPQDFVKMKIHMLEAYELFRKRYKNLLGLLPTENFVNTSLKIFSNIIFEINNIFVQIEIRNNDELIPSKKFEELNTTIGIVIPKLLLQNPKNWKPNIADITKEVIFTDLGIYIDINQPSMNVRDENRFNDLFKSKDHNWIMKPFTFSAIMRHVDGDTKIEFAPTIDTVYVHILEKHIPVFINLMNTMGKFLNKFSVAHIPKPNVYLFNTNGDKSSDDDQESAEKMWLYLHRCAVSKISNAKHDFSSKLDLVRKRLIYIKYFKKKDEKYKRMIREIEESLDYTNIIAFRSALRILKKRKRKTPHKKKKRKITPKITKEIKKLMVQDPVYIVTKFISVLSLNFIGHRVTLALEKNDGCPHFIIDMKNAHFLLGKQTSSLVMDAIISYISIKHVEKKTSTVFKSLDNPQLEMKAQVIIPFLSYSTWSMSLNMSSNNYFLNLRGILRMMTDLGLINLMKEIDQSPVKTNRIFDLSVNVRGSSLTVQTHKNHSLKFGFDRFSFTTDASSRSNVIRSMKLENSWIISNAAKTEVKISTDFSLTGSITQNKIFLNIPIFSVALPFTHIVIIEDIIGLITTYHKMFKNISVPSLSFEVFIDVKGLNSIIKFSDAHDKIPINIQKISVSVMQSQLELLIGELFIHDIMSLKYLTLFSNDDGLTLHTKYIYAKLFSILAMIPKDIMTMPKTDFSIPKLFLDIELDKLDIDLSLTNERFMIEVGDVKATANDNVFDVGAIMTSMSFQNLNIAKNIALESKIIIQKVTEIYVTFDELGINISPTYINYLLNISMPVEMIFPQEIGLKLMMFINKMIIANNFALQDLTVNMTINNSKFDIGFGMNAIDSSFLQIESKEMIKLNVDVQKSRVDVEVKLQKFILHVLPLMNLIAILPKLPSSSAKVNLNLIFHPVICSLVFNEDCFNIQFDKPIKFKLNTLKDSLQMMLKVSKLNVNLNQEKLVLIQSIDLEIGKSIKLDIPQIDVMISMLKLYKIYKMIKSMSIPSMGSSHDGEQDQKLYQLPYQSINLKLPVINIVIHQIKTMRCIFLSILENKFSMKKKSNKIDFSFVSKVIIGESDGFQANDLASPFYFRMNGRFSKNENYVNMKIAEPVQLIIKQKVFIEILKTLTSSETDIANPYSISNETGRDIKIIANGTEYKIKNQRKSQSIPSLYQANLSLKIGKKTVPINVLKLSSKLSIPLFFDEHFILVWADTKKLCLRFLSPLSFKNKANISIDLNINGIEINLKNGQKYCLDYAADQCNEITAKYNDVSQVIKLNETQVVDFNGYFVVVNRKRKESSLHSRVTFSTPFSIYQTLNCPLHISLCNQKHILKPCFYEPIPLLKPCAESIEFRIHRNEIFKGVNIYIQNNTNKLSVQAKCSKDGEPFSLRISILNNIIYISAAVVIYNSLSLPLDFSTTLEKTILPFKDEVDLFPIDSIVNNQYNKLNYDSPIMFSPNEKDGEPIYFGSAIVSPLKRTAQNNDEYQWCKQSIPIPSFEDQHDLILPIGNDNVSLIHTHVINHSENRPYSAIFFVSPKYRFVNNTEEHINLNLYDNDVIKLPARSSIPVTVIRKSLEFSFSVGKSIMSRKLNIDKIYSQFIKFRTFENPIHIELSHEKGVNLITFSTNHQLPYIFVNKTNSSKVTFIQKDSADFARTVHSDNSIPFFIYDENLPHIIFCKIGNDITAEIDIDKPSFPTKITDNLNYSVDKSGADGSIVYINESPICVKNEEIFDLSATVNYLSILLVSDGYHEFSRITIKKLLFDLKSTQLRQKLAFRIKSIQVDDQNIYACYPVIFQILPMTKKHAITLECTRHSNNKYDSIVIDIQPISLNIDLSFLSDIIGWIGIFNGKSYIIEKTHDVVQLSEIRANLSPRMTQYNIHNIKILPISINLTYNTLTTRNEHRYSHSFQFTRIYSLIPSMNNVNIGIGVHQFRNLSGTTDEIASQIFSKIKSDFIEQLSLKNIIIGSGKMITSVAKNLIVPENHGQQGRFSGITNKTKTILAIGETAFRQCSIIINAYTDSIPHARTDVTSVDAVKWGFSSLAYSFSKGLVSFMIEPFARGKNKGCCGYIEGTGVGIVKFAANSMAGVCDLGAGLMCGAKRLFYEDEIRKNREMEPLFRLKNHDDEELIWVATSIKSGLVEIYTKTIYIESINKQMKVTSKIDIKDNCVTFYQENDNKISCYFDEEVQAKVFYNIIHAQSLRQKVIKRIAKNSE